MARTKKQSATKVESIKHKDKRATIPGAMVRVSMLAARSFPNSLKLPITKRLYEP